MKRIPSISVLLAFALLGAVTIALAQEQEQQSQQPMPQQTWTADQLDNLVAPIALYPDPLLGQILVASTYPLEVVEARQWLQRNRNLRGQALVDAAKQQPWDPSVQALVAVPDALAKLNEDIRCATDLGNAFLAQQADVMSAVQRMRARAKDNGRLASTPQQSVTTQEKDGQQVVVIQPTNPQVIYVPTYDPYYVWGPPLYGYYPPLYYPAFGFGFGFGFDLGFCFGGWGGWGFWGWGPSWWGHSVYVNNYFFNHYGYHQHHGGGYHGNTAWVHDPGHRMHVPYGNSQVAARFGGGAPGARDSFRGGAGPGRAASTYAGRSEGRSVGRGGELGYRGAPSQAQSYRNPPRPQNQSSQQYRSSTSQLRTAPQTGRYQNAPRQTDQAAQPYRSTVQQYRTAPQGERLQSQPQQRYIAPQAFRSAPQIRQFQSQPQQRFQAPQQFRSAPQMSAPRFGGGGSLNRGGSGSGIVSRGGGGSFNRGGGGFSQSGGGSFGRGGGGGGGGSRHR